MGGKLRYVGLGFLVFCFLLMLGTLGYRVAGLSWLDSLYQTVVTMTTVGYGDLAPSVKPFTITLILFGTLSLAVMVSLLTGLVVETRIEDVIGRRKMENTIRKLNNHVIVCGFGRLGRKAAEELLRKGSPVVVIESDPAKAEAAREIGCPVIEHDATEEEALTAAGIEQADGLLSTLGSDADNVYVTLTAKQVHPEAKVVTIAANERARSKLSAAGADEIVMPYQVGGNWMAQAVTSPAVADFLKIATGDNPVDFFMDEQTLKGTSQLCGQALKETPIRQKLGVIVVAVRHPDGRLVTNPAPDILLKAGDVLVSLGQRDSLQQLKTMAAGS
ncbi:MAG: potassium channel family protein [Planctomycetota bacterium]